jgi:hypothetical protein
VATLLITGETTVVDVVDADDTAGAGVFEEEEDEEEVVGSPEL